MSKDVTATEKANAIPKPKEKKSAETKVSKDQKPKLGFFKRIKRYFKDLKSEWKKIVWPTRKQVLNNTGVVLAFMGASAVVIWGLNLIFIELVKVVFK
ncbi:MAG: preprotein translocase subunit SecE [Oscillospiraceae bacterium]